jgi:hypothetical protein
LGRFDERIRLLMQQFTQSMYRGEVIRFLPPGTGCSMTASNANYNDVTSIIAETLYQMKLAGPSTSYNYKTGSTTIPSCDPNTSALTGTGDSECFWKYRFVVPESSSEKIKKMVVFFSGGEMGCGMDPAVNNYDDVMKEYAKDNYIAVCVQTYPDSTKSGVYPFHKEANRINTVLHSIRTNPDIQNIWTGEYLLFSGVSHGATSPLASMARFDYDSVNSDWKGALKTAACFFDGIYDIPSQMDFNEQHQCRLDNLLDVGALPMERLIYRYCWNMTGCSDLLSPEKGGGDSILDVPSNDFFIKDWKLISAGADTLKPCDRDVVVNSPIQLLCDKFNQSGTHHCDYVDLPFSPGGYTHKNCSIRETKECREWFNLLADSSH